MRTTHDLITALKLELKAAGITYAVLAGHLGMAESSIKRIFAKGDMPLSRIDEVLRVLKMDFAELARKVADAQPLCHELTMAQEAAVVADRKLMLVVICCVSLWTFEQVLATYGLNDAEGFRWRPQGPVKAFFRKHVIEDSLGVGMRSWLFSAFRDRKREP